jgi:hypothetical protein
MSTEHLPFFFSQFLSAPCAISVIREIESSSGAQRCQHDIRPSFSLNPSLPSVCLSVCLSVFFSYNFNGSISSEDEVSVWRFGGRQRGDRVCEYNQLDMSGCAIITICKNTHHVMNPSG